MLNALHAPKDASAAETGADGVAASETPATESAGEPAGKEAEQPDETGEGGEEEEGEQDEEVLDFKNVQ